MNGVIKGSIVHIHRARTVIIDTDGMITASELGIHAGQHLVVLNVAVLLISAFIFNAHSIHCIFMIYEILTISLLM